MLPKCLFLYSGHPLYDATCGPLQLARFGFLASLFGHPLWKWFSPQIRHFCLDLEFLAEWPKLWQLKHCMSETGDRNSSTSFTMPVTWQTKFWEIRASALVGLLISSWKTLPSFLLFKHSALVVRDFVEIKELYKLFIRYIGWYSFYSKTVGFHFTGLEGFRETNLYIFAKCCLHFTLFCSIMTSCTESPITTKLPFGSSSILEILRLGWYCLNSPISGL